MRSPDAAHFAPSRSRHGATSVDLRSASIFRREGAYWTIAYRGTVFRLRDVKGLRCVEMNKNWRGARTRFDREAQRRPELCLQRNQTPFNQEGRGGRNGITA